MKQIVITILVLGAISAVRGTTNGQGTLYPFEIDSLLTCYTQVKTVDGDTTIVLEEPPRLPYGMRVQQGGQRVFLPQDTQFRQPPFVLTQELEQRLLNFLGQSPANVLLTSVNRPIRDPPRACDNLPAFEGSAGQTKKHEEVIDEPFPLDQDIFNSEAFISTLPSTYDLSQPQFTLPGRDQIMRDETTSTDLLGSVINPTRFRGRQFFFDGNFRAFLNDIEEMCPLWIAKCPLTTVWAELPQTFFPRYIAQGACSGKNCSYPRGLHCEEDFTYSVYVTVLRWDCCYNAFLGQLRWDCGWRKVQVPLLCDCTCGCGPVFPNVLSSTG